MLKAMPIVCALNLFCLSPGALAHYLWVTVDAQEGDHGTAEIHFEETPSAGEGRYLDRFAETLKTWVRTIDHAEPGMIATRDVRKDGKRWLTARLRAGPPRSIDTYGRFGVYAYGKTNVLLHYYARNLEVRSHEDLHELGRAEHLDLDIVPHDEESEVELTVLWKGRPAAERRVHILGPKRFRKTVRTDAEGRARFAPDEAGSYTFRTSVEQPIAGREGGRTYALIRHNLTMIMTLPLEK